MVASSSTTLTDRNSLRHPFLPVLRHGIYRERMAETVTDSMRAILLELAHYQVKVFEFIGGEHTSKNVMITAVKRERRRSAKELSDLRQTLQDLALVNGVREHNQPPGWRKNWVNKLKLRSCLAS
ncbi:methyltransferase domain-containing protein [Fragilaria crotonensis]|nr:methyltransferase domain-containing protein [Fragilaria crotonensis]